MAKETISQTEGLCKEATTCIRIAYDKGYKQGQKDMEQDSIAILEDGQRLGRVEAWECCRKLFATMPEKDIEQAFYPEWHNGGFNALMNLDVTDAIRRVEEYEKKKKDDEIKVGDEVVWNDHEKGIVIEINDCYLRGFTSRLCLFEWRKEFCIRTGRHFDQIAEVLEQLKGE